MDENLVQQFVSLVAEMRHAQKEYFRTRSNAALTHSVRTEKRVDKMLQEMAGGEQAKLF